MTTEQPVRAPTGLPYGEKQKLEQAQQAIPLPAQPGPQVNSQQQQAPVERPEVFAPTARPGEPLTAGAGVGPGPSRLELLPPDPVAHLRALYQRFPHEDLRRLLERASESRPAAAAASGTPRPASPGSGRSQPGTGSAATPQPQSQTPPPAAPPAPQTGTPV